MKVLVVDDNQTFRRQTARYLSLHDINVDTAARGAEAVQALRRQPYDVVLLDLKMPDMHGLDVLRQARGEGIRSPFIVVTGYGDVSSAVEAMKIGAADFLEKPFEPKRLLKLIQETAASRQDLPSTGARLQSLLTDRDADTAMLLLAEQPVQLERWLSFTADEHVSLAAKDVSLTDLQETIASFVEDHDQAFLVHADIHLLYERQDADTVKRYLSYLHRCADADGVTLLMLYHPGTEQAVLDRMADDDPVTLFVEEAIEILDHPIRRDILHLLQQNESLPYSFFLKHMDIDYSAKLAFHLNRLQESNLVEKTDAGYMLTERGHSFATVYGSLLLQRHHDAGSNVLYYPLPGDTDEAGGGI